MELNYVKGSNPWQKVKCKKMIKKTLVSNLFSKISPVSDLFSKIWQFLNELFDIAG
jgi:recombinational DNA repair protein RecT